MFSRLKKSRKSAVASLVIGCVFSWVKSVVALTYIIDYRFLRMANPENSLAKLNLVKRIRMALDYQEKQEKTLENITNEPIKLFKNNSKLGSDFSIARSANDLLRNEITKLQHQCWCNVQYLWCEKLEISGYRQSWKILT